MNRELTTSILPTGSIRLEWRQSTEKINKSTELLQREIYKRYDEEPDAWLLYLSFCDAEVPLSPALSFWRNYTSLFTNRLIKTPDLEVIRDQVSVDIADHELRQLYEKMPLMPGAEYLNNNKLKNIWSSLAASFSLKMQAFNGTVAEFISHYSRKIHLVGRIFFHLVENTNNNLPFAFMATYSTRLSNDGKSKHLPLKFALEEYEKDQGKMLELLLAVHQAAGQSRLLSKLLESGKLFLPLAWTVDEAYSFLQDIPIFEKSGILCRIPKWWNGNRPNFKLDFIIGDQPPSHVGMNAILNFKVNLCLGDVSLSPKEIQMLLNMSGGLSYIRNAWIPIDREKLYITMEALKKARQLLKKKGFTLRDAIRFQLNPQQLLGKTISIDDIGLSHGKWLETVLEKTANLKTATPVQPSVSFKAILRPYQEDGVNWLYYMHQLKFGICLADDMGLGKTIQVLAFLDLLKAENCGKASLLIAPASLISNWMNEIQRFAPELKVFIAHSDRNRNGQPSELAPAETDQHDVILTSYTLAAKHVWLQRHQWNYVILDEAQTIKNPNTKQAKTIKKLKSANRIIMTGTPIENRLTDLWSLFDFINPGLLGSLIEFKGFSKELKNTASGYAKLKKIIRPFILRRLKTDKSVITDLPEKVEMNSYAMLTNKQVALYQELVDYLKNGIPQTEGIQRKGLILSSLMKLKQICNHPDQFLGNQAFSIDESGKFQRLKELCEIIYEKREKVLVFSQFKKITQPLANFMSHIFEREGLVLHGSTPVGKRKEIIEAFQSDKYIPFIVLTLKAGGVGLNLTEASHVIHFDRWWNPAVENQATDRAFRIGQQNKVIVHKFISQGTVEEKIHAMISEKSALSAEIIEGTGEGWITGMKNEELLDFFNLSL